LSVKAGAQPEEPNALTGRSPVASSKASQTLQARSPRRRDDRLLSCGSPGLRRPPNTVEPYWFGSPSSPLHRYSRCSTLRSSGGRLRAGNPKITCPRLPCPQAPLQSMTTAASPSTPLPDPAHRPALSGVSGHTGERLPASSSVTAGAPTVPDFGHEDRSSRCSTQRPAGATSEETDTGHGPMGEGHGTNHEGPYRTAPSETPTTEAGSVRCRTLSGRSGKPPPTCAPPHDSRLRRATVTSRDTRESPRRRARRKPHAGARHVVVSPSASLRPGSPEKASRRIASSRRM
jgi:hypothetical protein